MTPVFIATVWLLSSVDIIDVLLFILSFRLLYYCFEVIDIYFRARLDVKPMTVIRCANTVIFIVAKLIWWSQSGGLLSIAVIAVLEQCFLAVLLFGLLVKRGDVPTTADPSRHVVSHFLKQSWPIILSDLLVILFFKLGQVMVMHLLDAQALGFYSAALKIVEVLIFVPQVIMFATYPRLAQLSPSSLAFQTLLTHIIRLVLILSVGMYLLLMFFGESVILVLFGEGYTQSAQLLPYLAVGIFFTHIGTVRGYWVVSLGLQKYHLHSAIQGLIVLVTFNLILIPLYGLTGAAIAACIAYFVNSIASIWILKPLRPFGSVLGGVQ